MRPPKKRRVLRRRPVQVWSPEDTRELLAALALQEACEQPPVEHQPCDVVDIDTRRPQ